MIPDPAPPPPTVDLVLVAPQIAGNTGNIIRLCANVGARLHLVRPLGFGFEDAALRRAGLDYHDLADVRIWETLPECRSGIGADARWFATTSREPERRYDDVAYRDGDVVVFGCEATGLPEEVLEEFPRDRRLHIPMRPSNRSLNLANAVSVVAYEAWRQRGFDGASTEPFDATRRAHDEGFA